MQPHTLQGRVGSSCGNRTSGHGQAHASTAAALSGSSATPNVPMYDGGASPFVPASATATPTSRKRAAKHETPAPSARIACFSSPPAAQQSEAFCTPLTATPSQPVAATAAASPITVTQPAPGAQSPPSAKQRLRALFKKHRRSASSPRPRTAPLSDMQNVSPAQFDAHDGITPGERSVLVTGGDRPARSRADVAPPPPLSDEDSCVGCENTEPASEPSRVDEQMSTGDRVRLGESTPGPSSHRLGLRKHEEDSLLLGTLSSESSSEHLARDPPPLMASRSMQLAGAPCGGLGLSPVPESENSHSEVSHDRTGRAHDHDDATSSRAPAHCVSPDRALSSSAAAARATRGMMLASVSGMAPSPGDDDGAAPSHSMPRSSVAFQQRGHSAQPTRESRDVDRATEPSKRTQTVHPKASAAGALNPNHSYEDPWAQPQSGRPTTPNYRVTRGLERQADRANRRMSMPAHSTSTLNTSSPSYMRPTLKSSLSQAQRPDTAPITSVIHRSGSGTERLLATSSMGGMRPVPPLPATAPWPTAEASIADTSRRLSMPSASVCDILSRNGTPRKGATAARNTPQKVGAPAALAQRKCAGPMPPFVAGGRVPTTVAGEVAWSGEHSNKLRAMAAGNTGEAQQDTDVPPALLRGAVLPAVADEGTYRCMT